MSDSKAQLTIQISYLVLAYFTFLMFIQAQWMMRDTFSSLKDTFILIDSIIFAFLLLDTGYFIYKEYQKRKLLNTSEPQNELQHEPHKEANEEE